MKIAKLPLKNSARRLFVFFYVFKHQTIILGKKVERRGRSRTSTEKSIILMMTRAETSHNMDCMHVQSTFVSRRVAIPFLFKS